VHNVELVQVEHWVGHVKQLLFDAYYPERQPETHELFEG